MKNLVQKLKNGLNYIGAKTAFMTFVVFLTAAGIAVFVGNGLYKTEKQVLQLQGEVNAKESALKYNNWLVTRANIVTLVGCSVDDMLKSGTESSVIEAFLTNQSDHVIATLDPSSTGLYGWIGGNYLDGAGWVPDADYVATERPWYTQTMASDQGITFIEPYLDMQTHTVLMTVSERLSDGQSVLAMDVSLEPLQQIVEQIASSADGSQAFVIDRSGNVVAHSDKSLLGRNFLDDADNTIGGAISRRILADGRRQFDITTDQGSFSVYVDTLEGGWYSVSLINADIWYRPLVRVMIIFSAILLLVMLFLTFIFLRIYAKNRTLQNLHTRIEQEQKRGKELQMLSETDRMTGLYDRVTGKRRVDDLLTFNIQGTFFELDIDHFKSINDTYGHQTGDLVILSVADALRSAFRSNDITMRLGGDEFGVFAVGILERNSAEGLIRRLFERVEALDIPGLKGRKVCISAGAVICTGGRAWTFDDLYAVSDKALYASKKISGSSLTLEN